MDWNGKSTCPYVGFEKYKEPKELYHFIYALIFQHSLSRYVADELVIFVFYLGFGEATLICLEY